MYVLLSVILIVLGLVMLCRPDIFYALTEGWKHRGSDAPSRLYLFSTRFGGVLMLLAGGSGILIWVLGWG